MEQRNVLILSLFTWSKDDADAIAKAQELADSIAKTNDNHCSVVSLTEAPFGKPFDSRLFYGQELVAK